MGVAATQAFSTRASSARALLVAGGGLAPCLPLWLWWALDNGGHSASVWLPGLPLLSVVCCALVLALPRPTLGGARAWALAALVALAAWTWLSATWATDPGAAVLEAERRSLYLASFALPLLWPPSQGALVAGLVAVPVTALAALIAAFAAAFGGDGLSDGRLTGTFLYANALAALLAAGALVSLVLAADRRATAALRGFAWGGAGVLAAGSLLTQSRGGIAALVAVGVGALVLAPFRARLVPPVLAVAAGCALASGPMLAVRAAALAGHPDPALVEAATTLFVLGGALAAAALACTAFARSDLAERARARLAAARTSVPRLRPLLAAIALAATAIALVAGGPRAWVEERFDDFVTRDYDRIEAADSRFAGGLGSNRADYWRVALETARAEPLGGAGAGGFRARYLEARDTSATPRYAHGIWFATLGELGLVGLALLLAFAIAITLGAIAAVWAGTASAHVVRVAALVPLAYLAVHASADWVGAFPALVVPALGLAGAGLAPTADPARPRRALAVAAAVTASLLALSAVPLMQAERLTSSALAANASGAPPGEALAALRTAEDWNPLAAQPALARGMVCAELSRLGCARRGFEIAAARDSGGWLQRLQLGLLAEAVGDRAEARIRLAEANRLNPRERLVDRSLAALEGPGSMTAPRLARRLLAQQGLARRHGDG